MKSRVVYETKCSGSAFINVVDLHSFMLGRQAGMLPLGYQKIKRCRSHIGQRRALCCGSGISIECIVLDACRTVGKLDHRSCLG